MNPDGQCDVMLNSGSRCQNIAPIVAIIDPGPTGRFGSDSWFGRCAFCEEHQDTYYQYRRHPDSIELKGLDELMDDRQFRVRDELSQLGWNQGNSAHTSHGDSLTLREVPYTSDVEGMRTLTIHGPSIEEALLAFVDELVEVRLDNPMSHAAAYFVESGGPSGPYTFYVRPVSPRLGEDQDVWQVMVDHPEAQRFFDALGNDTVLTIRRGSARLTNTDERGKRNY